MHWFLVQKPKPKGGKNYVCWKSNKGIVSNAKRSPTSLVSPQIRELSVILAHFLQAEPVADAEMLQELQEREIRMVNSLQEELGHKTPEIVVRILKHLRCIHTNIGLQRILQDLSRLWLSFSGLFLERKQQKNVWIKSGLCADKVFQKTLLPCILITNWRVLVFLFQWWHRWHLVLSFKTRAHSGSPEARQQNRRGWKWNSRSQSVSSNQKNGSCDERSYEEKGSNP